MSESNLPIRHRVIYHGRVQGVGFRFTVANIARRHPVRGYVRNLADGTVELAVDALPADFQRFHDEIQEAFSGNITDAKVTPLEIGAPFESFEIRH
jgi:acylphosphatase